VLRIRFQPVGLLRPERDLGDVRECWRAPIPAGEKVLDRFVAGGTVTGTTTVRSGVPLRGQGTTGLWWNPGDASNGEFGRPVFVHPRARLDASRRKTRFSAVQLLAHARGSV